MSRHSRGVTEDQRKEAENVLYRMYRDWVNSEVTALAEAVFEGYIEDAEGLRETMEQNTDSSLIYTHDQRMVIYVSESVNDGEGRMEDMGGGGDNPTAVLALLTYQADVEGAMERAGMDLNDFDRVEWVKGGFNGDEELQVLWDKHCSKNGTPDWFEAEEE